MSSTYPVLNGRPIDQWSVAELKDELKRRKLVTKGLKEDLINRLDEALRTENENNKVPEEHEVNGFNGNAAEINNAHTETVVAAVVDTVERKSAEIVETDEKGNSAVVHPIGIENAEMIPEAVKNHGEKSDKEYGNTMSVDNNSSPMVDQEVEHMDFAAGADSGNVAEDLIHSSPKETTVTVTESFFTEVVVNGQEGSYSAEPQNGHGQDCVIKHENKESSMRLIDEELKSQLECDLRTPCEHPSPNSMLSENQVSEVNPSLGSQVKSDSVSNNFVSINQKNELKDTIIANNNKLEQVIVRSEMVEEPSSRINVPVYDESHSMDVEELNEKKASVEENSSNNESPNLNETNSSEDFGYPEKLNLDQLDRSSGDDSMEEDLPESKQFDSKFNDEIGGKGESVEIPIVKEERGTVVAGDGLSSVKGGTHNINNIASVSLIKKQKFNGPTSVGNNEPAKRQRRWNSETVKGSVPLMSTGRPATTPKGEPIVALKRKFSRSDSSSVNDAPKERIVPPSQRAPTNSLRIDRFLRPFTLKAVHDLLGKTGNVTSFWMDQIKTHCYVTYSSVEEAAETRNAVYNLKWPPNGGKLLVAQFVEPQEVKMKLEPPPHVASVNNDSTVLSVTPTSLPEPPPSQHREQLPVPVSLPPPPPLSKLPPAARERLPLPPSQLPPLLPLPEKVDQPVVTLDGQFCKTINLPPPPQQLPPPPPVPAKVDKPRLTVDDIFRKTKATPRIYYLPLSEEQVAAKFAAQYKGID